MVLISSLMHSLPVRVSVHLVEIRKSAQRELSVPDGVLNVLVAEKILDQPSVSAAVGQVVAGRAPQSVRGDVQIAKLGRVCIFMDHCPDSGARKRRALFRQK